MINCCSSFGEQMCVAKDAKTALRRHRTAVALTDVAVATLHRSEFKQMKK
eukprot:SAG22_NODE_10855_length_513_cov_0.871981_1_plen_49_part_10